MVATIAIVSMTAITTVVDMTVAATATAAEEAVARAIGGGYDRGGYNDRDRGGYDRGGYNDRGGGKGGGDNFSRKPSSTGRIAVLKEGFGFIDCADEAASQGGTAMKAQHFFSMSSILGRENPRIGDEVRYFVEVDRRSGKDAAVRVEILPPGTLPPPPKPPEVDLQGVIEYLAQCRPPRRRWRGA